MLKTFKILTEHAKSFDQILLFKKKWSHQDLSKSGNRYKEFMMRRQSKKKCQLQRHAKFRLMKLITNSHLRRIKIENMTS